VITGAGHERALYTRQGRLSQVVRDWLWASVASRSGPPLFLGVHMTILDDDYVNSFLRSHHPYDYAKEPITYPRTHMRRQYTDDNIKYGCVHLPFGKKNKFITASLRPCRPSLLEYHLRESTNCGECEIVSGWNRRTKEEYYKYYGPRWILTTYYDYAFVNFIQVDIDRHGEDDSRAHEQVALLEKAASQYGFGIAWTTSPGSKNRDGSFRHGLYAWIRLQSDHFVMDIRDSVKGWLSDIGLSDIVQDNEGAYLKRKKLVRLPGQYNVELANPQTFKKLFIHSPVEASKAFQEAWLSVTPLKDELLLSSSPPSPRRHNKHTYTHSSVPLSPLSPTSDTFISLLKWGRPIVNKHHPDESRRQDCIAELVAVAEQNLPAGSRTRQQNDILAAKAQQVVNYLWSHTDPNIKIQTTTLTEDSARFEPHARHICDHRDDLIQAVEERDRRAANQILDLLRKHHGRIAVVELYHTSGKGRICGHYRQWRRIRDAMGIVTIEDYEKPVRGRGKCRQYGIRDVEPSVR
jgi:hypothetical protein